MENQTNAHSYGTRLIDEINTALAGCQMSARGFFFALIPLLQGAEVRGFLDMDLHDLAHHFRLSAQKTGIYVRELEKKKIIRVRPNGEIMCPIIIRQWYRQ